MGIATLITSKDGSFSLTKLAAATAHFLMACAFLRLQVIGEAGFDSEIWYVYGGFAILHAAYDKTAAQVKDVREKRIEADKVAPHTETVTTITQTTP